MLKKLHILLLTLLAAVCFTVTAWADYDYIEQYGVMVTPNTEDGSLLITVKLEWTPLEELPYGQELKIGVPNGSIRDVAAQTDNIERLDFDNSYMYVYLDRGYDANETFSFAYSWVQEYMYQLDGSAVTYDYTAGWFDEAKIGQMTLVWNDPAGLTGDFTEGTVSGADSVTVQDGMTISASNLDYGYKMNIQVRYTDWPIQLSEEYSADNVPDGGWNGSDDYHYDDDDTGDAIIGMMGDDLRGDVHPRADLRRPPGRRLCRRLRHPVCVRQQPVVPSGAGRPPEARQRRHEAPSRAAPVSPQRRLRRRQPRRRVWRRRLRWGWRTLRLRQQLRLRVRVCLRRRRPRGLQRQEPLRCHPPRRFSDQKSGGVTYMIED